MFMPWIEPANDKQHWISFVCYVFPSLCMLSNFKIFIRIPLAINRTFNSLVILIKTSSRSIIEWFLRKMLNIALRSQFGLNMLKCRKEMNIRKQRSNRFKMNRQGAFKYYHKHQTARVNEFNSKYLDSSSLFFPSKFHGFFAHCKIEFKWYTSSTLIILHVFSER